MPTCPPPLWGDLPPCGVPERDPHEIRLMLAQALRVMTERLLTMHDQEILQLVVINKEYNEFSFEGSKLTVEMIFPGPYSDMVWEHTPEQKAYYEQQAQSRDQKTEEVRVLTAEEIKFLTDKTAADEKS